MFTITLIPGDGIGPEISEATKQAIEATGVDIRWDVQEAGQDVFEKEGTPLPQRVIDSIRKNRVALKGSITTPVGTGFRSVNDSSIGCAPHDDGFSSQFRVVRLLNRGVEGIHVYMENQTRHDKKGLSTDAALSRN